MAEIKYSMGPRESLANGSFRTIFSATDGKFTVTHAVHQEARDGVIPTPGMHLLDGPGDTTRTVRELLNAALTAQRNG